MNTPTTKEVPHHNSLKTFAVGWIIVSCVVIAVVSTLLATVADRPALPIALGLATALTSIGAVLLFFRGLKDYKDALRRAYILISVGVILYALAQLQFPMFALIDVSLWINSGGVLVPYVFSIIFIFFGTRLYAKLIDIHTPWRSFLLALGSAIATAALVGLMAQGELAFLLQFETLLSVILFFSTMTTLKIRSVISDRYRRPITFMAAGFGMLAFSAFHHVITTMVLPLDSWYLLSELPSLPILFAALLFFIAGYESAMVDNRAAEQVQQASPIDVITYVAGIVSRPTEIDDILDKLRLITSSSEKRNQLTPEEEKVLANAYIEIETYLIKNEPLQKMDQTRLRLMVRNRFTFDPATKSPFWSLFKTPSAA